MLLRQGRHALNIKLALRRLVSEPGRYAFFDDLKLFLERQELLRQAIEQVLRSCQGRVGCLHLTLILREPIADVGTEALERHARLIVGSRRHCLFALNELRA